MSTIQQIVPGRFRVPTWEMEVVSMDIRLSQVASGTDLGSGNREIVLLKLEAGCFLKKKNCYHALYMKRYHVYRRMKLSNTTILPLFDRDEYARIRANREKVHILK